MIYDCPACKHSFGDGKRKHPVPKALCVQCAENVNRVRVGLDPIADVTDEEWAGAEIELERRYGAPAQDARLIESARLAGGDGDLHPFGGD